MNSTRVNVTVLLCTLLASGALAQTVVTREGTGEAAISNKDEPKAVEEATQRALRNAVEQAAGVKIDADTLVVNNQLVRDQVFANTSGYVKSSTIVSKKTSDRGVVTIVVKADVITDNLDKDIDAARQLIKRMGRPSIVILVNEQTLQLGEKGSAITTSDTVANVLTQAFKADGWDVKDPAYAAGKLHIAPGATLGAAESKEIADLSKAGYFLYGTATLRNAEYDTWMKGPNEKQAIFPVTGEYDLALFGSATGSVVAKTSGKLGFQNITARDKSAPGPGAPSFLISYERTAFDIIQFRKAEIIDSVRKGVLESFRDALVNGVNVTLTAGGLESFSAAGQFLKALEALKSVKSVEQQQFDKGRATYRVLYLGSTAQLAESLEEANFKKRKLDVTTVTDARVEVQVGK
jgi:hypothetical protein